MPDKYLVEFMAKWIRDEEMRAKILHKEVQAMAEWGLTAQQGSDLRSLDRQRIIDRLVDELEDELGIDLDAILQDFANTNGGRGPFTAGAVYDEGSAHVRGIDPAKIQAAMESVVIVRGHGWDDSLQIFFTPPGGGAPVEGEVLDLDSDVDVWQRATVKVTLPSPGDWRVSARVTGSAPSNENVDLEVE